MSGRKAKCRSPACRNPRKTDPVTFVAEDIETYTIFVNSNDIAAMGGRPLWFLATVLLPEGLLSR
ncbi:MAG: AIR synthase related protein [Deltaproteobacteria bacterium]|nr:AIR synthase related protein [Deltaproteobacteria bacterium]